MIDAFVFTEEGITKGSAPSVQLDLSSESPFEGLHPLVPVVCVVDNDSLVQLRKRGLVIDRGKKGGRGLERKLLHGPAGIRSVDGSAYTSLGRLIEGIKKFMAHVRKEEKKPSIYVVGANAKVFSALKKESREAQALPYPGEQGGHSPGDLIGQSQVIQNTRSFIEAAAIPDVPVLILGESGTGKDLVASSIHYCSARCDGPFVKVDCGALAEGLLESELFGHVKGAFTGATGDRVGRFELADGGTIFLDEIGNLSVRLQAKLLRVIEDGAFEKVGGGEPQSVRVRIVAATNRELKLEAAEGRFREDLYHRLNVLTHRIAPLRERESDIALLLDYFLEAYNRQYGRAMSFADEAREALQAYSWPGNVRELCHAIERLVICTSRDTSTIGMSELGSFAADVVQGSTFRKLPPLSNVPELPRHFQRRPEVFDEIKTTLLAGTGQATGLVGPGAGVGVHGMGGVGKTALAVALARDKDVRRAFPGGVCWLSIGQNNVDIVSRQIQLAEAMGATDTAFRDVQYNRARLERLLRDKACLIILDDVWDFEHAVEFACVLGAKSRLLVTTRNTDVVRDLGGATHEVDKLTQDQALALLAGWAGSTVAELPDVAEEVARECGNLALALAMIGAMVAKPSGNWESALARLKNSDLAKIRSQFPGCPYPSLLRAIQVSVDALTEPQRECYLSFAVFPEDTPVPEAVLQRLWRTPALDEYDCIEILDELHGRSLIRRNREGQFTLHDLQFDYVRKQWPKLSELHSGLLDSCRRECAGGWHTGPDDGYFFENLLYHLDGAGKRDEARSLLLDFRWLQAKLTATDEVRLSSDYDYFSKDSSLRLVQTAIRLSRSALFRDKGLLWTQLYGRLMTEDDAGIRGLLDQTRLKGPRFRSVRPSMVPPVEGLLACLEGHTAPVLAVFVTPDGTVGLSGGEDRTVRVWDLKDNRSLRTLKGHTKSVVVVSMTADGKLGVSGSDDETLRVWDLGTGRLLRTLEGHAGSVVAASMTPDGKLILSGSEDGTLKVWSPNADGPLHTLKGHAGTVLAASMTADGKLGISGSEDRTLKVWDLSSGSPSRTLEGHKASVTSVSLTPDGTCAVSGAADGSLFVWDLAEGTRLKTLAGHDAGVDEVLVLGDGKHVLSWASNSTLKTWDLLEGSLLQEVRARPGWIVDVWATPDGRLGISGSEDATVKVWNMQSKTLQRTLEEHTGRVGAVAVASNGRVGISGSEDRTLKVWDVKTGGLLRTLEGHEEPVRAVSLTADGMLAIAGSENGTLRLWDTSTGQLLRTFVSHGGAVLSASISADGRLGLSGSEDKTLKVWDLKAGRLLQTLKGHAGPVRTVSLTADGRLGLSGSEDKTLKVWDMKMGGLLRTLKDHAGPVLAASMTADGKLGVSGSADKTLKVWDLSNGSLLRELKGHEESITSVSLTPDGALVASGALDWTLRVWDPRTGQSVAAFIAEDAILSCAIANSDSIIVGEQSSRTHLLTLEGV